MTKIDKIHCQQLDQVDELSEMKNLFDLPLDKINMDGNSLGSLPKTTLKKVNQVIDHEWGQNLIASWGSAGWIDAPTRLGNKIAPLIGANDGEVIVSDSTSVNLFKVICAALSIQNDRQVILTTDDNFPTDLYMIQGLEKWSPDRAKYKSVDRSEILTSITEEVAVVVLTHVNYKSAEILPMGEITKKAHQKGALIIWDLSHSTGSVPVDLNKCQVDFAIGCGYKFLNGGPGAPGFLFVSKKHQNNTFPILSGWMGHKDPFAFAEDYEAGLGVEKYRCGTPGIIGMAALESGLDLFSNVDIDKLRSKAIELSELFIILMEQECAEFSFELVSPKNADVRGGHVAYSHKSAFSIYQAIKSKGVISDFRTPNILRFGITPLYLSFVDIYDVVSIIKQVITDGSYLNPEYAVRTRVT